MAENSFLKNLTEEQKNLGFRIFDLILARALREIYNSFNEELKLEMGQVFASEDDNKKEEFLKQHTDVFTKAFKDEAKKVEEELKKEVQAILA